MLTPEYLDHIPDELLELYYKFEESVIRDIARRLAKFDLLNVKSKDVAGAAWQMQRLTESGALYDQVLRELAKITGQSETILRNTFQKAGVRAINFDDAVYKAAGLTPTPLNPSPAMNQLMRTMLTLTNGTVRNLTNTTAITAQALFEDAADLAFMQVSTGAFDYNTAIRQAVISIADKGLSTINYLGKEEKLDVAVRRAVLTGVNQAAMKMQWERAEEMNCDLVETSAHIGARNKGTGPMNHESWQGRVFSRSGKNDKYPDFVSTTGYGTGEGLGGWNCRHNWYPFFEGISRRNYSDQQLTEMADKKVSYNGKELSVYEGTQIQRGIERKIRYWKRQKSALEAAGLDTTEELNKIKHYQAVMRDFTKQTGLDRQYEREQALFFVNDLSKNASVIDFRSEESQHIADLADVRDFYSLDDPGREFAIPRPVIYNNFGFSHFLSDETHKKRIPWIEARIDKVIKAISNPEYIEARLRVRKDGYFSATYLVDLGINESSEKRFLAVAISLGKDLVNGYHQITTIQPIRASAVFKPDGSLKEKYLRIK